ncbi:hypothetical protein HZH66_001715 [Vespula vulgaris]|uniref:Uncharacterized protein n=1 Tax=Vespula vulgaris TaxID=7454 RepID=A0A834NH30_VESVU|nr:hypothetical protein HZH66_001715 [Vespula vulgaris]
MVDLSGPDTPYQHGFNNVVFVLPAIIVGGLSARRINRWCSIRMWMSILSGLETFVSVYAADKVVSESVSDTEKSQTADFDGSLPNTQQLLEMLDSITGMSEEEKADLRADLMKDIQGRASDVQQMPTRDLVNQTFILLSLLAVVALIFALDQVFEMGESILENLRNIGALSKKQEEKLIDMLLRLKNLEDQDKKDFMKEAKEFVKEIINDWSSAASFSSSMQSNVLLFLAIFLIFFVIGTTISRGSDYESELTYVIRN